MVVAGVSVGSVMVGGDSFRDFGVSAVVRGASTLFLVLSNRLSFRSFSRGLSFK